MMRKYELTDEEFTTVLDALEHARMGAVHSDARARFHQAKVEMVRQHEEQDPYSAAEADSA